jgi:hypothetical protein
LQQGCKEVYEEEEEKKKKKKPFKLLSMPREAQLVFYLQPDSKEE